MTPEQDIKPAKENALSKFAIDSTIIITILTVLAYFFGIQCIHFFWKNIGLKGQVAPDVSFSGIMNAGGCVVFITSLLLLAPYYAFWKSTHGEFKDNRYVRFCNENKISLYLVLVVIFIFVSIGVSWMTANDSAANFFSDRKQIEKVILASGQTLDKQEELVYLGEMKTSTILLRTTGDMKGEVILIPDSEIKLISMK